MAVIELIFIIFDLSTFNELFHNVSENSFYVFEDILKYNRIFLTKQKTLYMNYTERFTRRIILIDN